MNMAAVIQAASFLLKGFNLILLKCVFLLSSQSSSGQRVVEGSRLARHREMGPSDSHAQRVGHIGLQSES